MDDSSLSDGEGSFLTPTLASILGVKGCLRLRPHGSTQKAHVVLRRIELSDESGDDEETQSVAYFSLFAQKRFEVKPGKEILLAIASPDGEFKDQAVILEGDIPVSGESSEEEDVVHSTKEDGFDLQLVKQALPPKMRKAWTSTKRHGIRPTAYDVPRPSQSHKSVGVQAEPHLGSQSIKIEGGLVSTSVRAQEKYVSKHVQDDSLHHPPRVNPPPGSHKLLNQQIHATTPHPIPSRDNTHITKPPLWEDNHIRESHDRSLTIRELSSPVFCPATVPKTNLAPDMSPPSSRTSSVASSSDAQRLKSARRKQRVEVTPVRENVSHSHLPTPHSLSPITAEKALDHVTQDSDSRQPKSRCSSTELIPPKAMGSGPQSPLINVAGSGRAANNAFVSTRRRRSPLAPLRSETETPSDIFIRELPKDEGTDTHSDPRSRMNWNRPLAPSPPSHRRHDDSYYFPHFRRNAIAPPNESRRPPFRPLRSGPRQPPTRRSGFYNGRDLVEKATPAPNWSILQRSSPSPDPKSHMYNTSGPSSGPLNPRPPSRSAMRFPSSQCSPYPAISRPSTPPLPKRRWSRVRQPNGSAPGNSQSVTYGNRRSNSYNAFKWPRSSEPIQSNLVNTDLPPLREELSLSPRLRTLMPWPRYSLSTPQSVPPTSAGSVGMRNSPHANFSSTNLPSHHIPTTTINRSFGTDHLAPLSPQASQWSRGIKRVPDCQDADLWPPSKRLFSWPALGSIHSARLNGGGDLGIQGITLSLDGSLLALTCADRTVRIWSNITLKEMTRLTHNSAVVSVAWMDGDAGIMLLTDDGVVSQWTRTPQEHWQWTKILDACGGDRAEGGMCFAYSRGCIAVAFPREAVKLWMLIEGIWKPQHPIIWPNVSSIKFIPDGKGLFGGTTNGVLWYCPVPDGIPHGYTFVDSNVYCIEVNDTGDQVLIAQTGNRSNLVHIRHHLHSGKIEQIYSCKKLGVNQTKSSDFGAVFARWGRAVLSGTVEGCVLIWDRRKGEVVYGLDHGKEDTVQAVATYDGTRAFDDGYLITGTKHGRLTWWPQPRV